MYYKKEQAFGLELYETPFRSYDAQLGRFWQVEPLADEFHSISMFQFGFNNPISANDPSGLRVVYTLTGPQDTRNWFVGNNTHNERRGGGRNATTWDRPMGERNMTSFLSDLFNITPSGATIGGNGIRSMYNSYMDGASISYNSSQDGYWIKTSLLEGFTQEDYDLFKSLGGDVLLQAPGIQLSFFVNATNDKTPVPWKPLLPIIRDGIKFITGRLTVGQEIEMNAIDSRNPSSFYLEGAFHKYGTFTIKNDVLTVRRKIGLVNGGMLKDNSVSATGGGLKILGYGGFFFKEKDLNTGEVVYRLIGSYAGYGGELSIGNSVSFSIGKIFSDVGGGFKIGVKNKMGVAFKLFSFENPF